jgi:hypothetical protein
MVAHHLKGDTMNLTPQQLQAARELAAATGGPLEIVEIVAVKVTCGCWNFVNLGHCIHTVP